MKKTILLLCSVMLWHLTMAQQVSIPPVIKGVTVMVAFLDYPMNDPIQAVENLMNQPGYTQNSQIGSVRDYFYTQTSGKVTITSTVVKITLSNTYEYYKTSGVNYVDEAIDLINQNYPNGFHNLTPDPVDNKLLHINFLSRAPGHSSVVGASASPGKYLKHNTTGQIQVSEGNMTYFRPVDPLIINVICHEMGHSVMSWTDYYRTAYSNLGGFCVMGSGGTEIAPQPIDPALRMQRGWIDNVITVSGTTTQTYTLTANSYTTIHKYTNPNNPKEYLLFHALKAGGYYQTQLENKTLPEGLAIWYVDEESGYDSPLDPNFDNQRYIRLVQADNKDEMHDDFFGATDVGGDLEDLYGNANKSFPNGTPFRWKDGGEFGINITNISNPGTTMQFTVNARPNTVVASSDINGTISPKGTLSVANGQSKTFNLLPNPGYEIDQIKVDGSVVATANPFVLSGISGTKTVSVTFKRKTTQAALPNPWQKIAIGSVSSSDFAANAGNSYYLETHANAVGNADNLTYLYQPINGDGTYIVHLANYNTVKDQKVGLMIRETLEPNAAFAAITKMDLGGAIAIQRTSVGGEIKNNPNEVGELHRYELHNWLKIERTGDQIISSTSKDGTNWREHGNQNISMSSKAYIGLFAQGNTSYPTQVLFDNISFTTNPFPTVSITSPATGTVYSTNSVSITATAAPSVVGGSITKVDFYDNTTLIGTDNTAPFSFVWNNASGGIHAIIAKATDNTGKVAVSSKVAITTPCSSTGTKIQGTVIGTTGSWNNSGNTRDKAFDGDINTYFDADQSVAWAGLSLDSTYAVTNIRYVPRQDLESRMVGGIFQGSNVADFSIYTNLAVVSAKPASGWNCFDVSNTSAFKYLRYIGPEGAVGNVSEIEFYGTISIENQAPTVTITSPVSSSTFTAPATITITAEATDADGTIARVDFYKGGTLIGRDSIAPYSINVSIPNASSNIFAAVAYDNQGAYTTHIVNNIAVVANQAPTVSLTSPVNNSNHTAPATISLTATASDADGDIWRVEFYNGTTLVGTDYATPYQYTVFGLTTGTYSIKAIAFDNAGLASEPSVSTVNVIGNTVPTVNITSPVNTVNYTAPANITIIATATDADGTIDRVDFYQGTTLLGSDYNAPYSYYVSGLPVGSYSFTAVAFDNLGAVGTYTRTNIGVIQNTAPTVSITSPASNASFTAPATINIAANASDANGTVTKVEFFNGTTLLSTDVTAPYTYSWTNVAAGTYAITARASDNHGAYTEHIVSNISVTASTADITGPACANNNSTITYELSPAKRANATSYGWYFTGSTQSFTPSGYQTTLATGNYYGAGQVCVNVNYSVAPWYASYCITVPKCSSAREASTEEWSEMAVETKSVGFPNPFTGETTINLSAAADAQAASIQVYNAQGVLVEEATATSTYTFGHNLVSGIYFVKINTGNKTETLKLVKE